MNRLLVVSILPSPGYKMAARRGIEPRSSTWLAGTLSTIPNVTGGERYAARPGLELCGEEAESEYMKNSFLILKCWSYFCSVLKDNVVFEKRDASGCYFPWLVMQYVYWAKF
jgi:hypothetical protein